MARDAWQGGSRVESPLIRSQDLKSNPRSRPKTPPPLSRGAIEEQTESSHSGPATSTTRRTHSRRPNQAYPPTPTLGQCNNGRDCSGLNPQLERSFYYQGGIPCQVDRKSNAQIYSDYMISRTHLFRKGF